jgi:hypothetical protein
MTIIRREHRAYFTVLPNAIFVDQRLSIEAKGVLGYLLSRPNKWSVRLEQVGRTLKVGRRKLQRIFRELIGAGYVTREQRRIGSVQRYGQMDYVVRDVPVTIHPVDNSAKPRVQKGPAARSVQAIAASQESKLWPRVQNGPAYKELKKKETRQPEPAARAGGRHGLPAKAGRSAVGKDDDDARRDSEIVALFRDPAEGWEFLTELPTEGLAEVRARYCRGELDELAILELRNQFGHLQTKRRSPSSLKMR